MEPKALRGTARFPVPPVGGPGETAEFPSVFIDPVRDAFIVRGASGRQRFETRLSLVASLMVAKHSERFHAKASDLRAMYPFRFDAVIGEGRYRPAEMLVGLGTGIVVIRGVDDRWAYRASLSDVATTVVNLVKRSRAICRRQTRAEARRWSSRAERLYRTEATI